MDPSTALYASQFPEVDHGEQADAPYVDDADVVAPRAALVVLENTLISDTVIAPKGGLVEDSLA